MYMEFLEISNERDSFKLSKDVENQSRVEINRIYKYK